MKHKRPYKKRGVLKASIKNEATPGVEFWQEEATMSVEDLVRDVEKLIRMGHDVYRGVFLHLRRELIKTVGKIRDLKKEFEMKAEAEASLAMEK